VIATVSPSMQSLVHPEADDVAWGAVAAWLIFTPSSGIIMSLSMVFAGSGEYAVLALIVTLVGALIIGGVVALTGIVSASLVALLLARVRYWPVHLISYFLLGALTGLLTVLVLSGFNSSIWAFALVLGVPLPAVAMVVTGVSVATGWAMSWRRAARRGERAPAPTGIAVKRRAWTLSRRT
jgi:hypothetical protein